MHNEVVGYFLCSGKNSQNFYNIAQRLISSQRPKIIKPGLRAEKNLAYYAYKKNIVMTECLDILYPG